MAANASPDSLAHTELGCSDEEFMLALKRQDAPEATRDASAATPANAM